MKSRFASLVASLLPAILLTGSLNAQIAGRSSMPNSWGPDANVLALSGKVQVEGGRDVPSDATVVLECGSKEQKRVSVDSQGHFSMLAQPPAAPGGMPLKNDRIASSTFTDCRLYAEATGYQSSAVNLAGQQANGVVQVGTLMMASITGNNDRPEDFTVSVASLSAPANAKKEFQKGQEQAKKGKWAAATDYFRRAVRAYPRYALAWLELGRVQMQQNNVLDAQQSFQQAANQDSHLLPAYIELAKVQVDQKQWKALAETTGKIVQLAPNASAMFWFLDSAANYNLHEFAKAESSAVHGLRLDQGHRVPQLEYLYGLILGSRHDYRSAVQHLATYLQLAPRANDAKNAQQVLTDYQRLVSSEAATAAQR